MATKKQKKAHKRGAGQKKRKKKSTKITPGLWLLALLSCVTGIVNIVTIHSQDSAESTPMHKSKEAFMGGSTESVSDQEKQQKQQQPPSESRSEKTQVKVAVLRKQTSQKHVETPAAVSHHASTVPVPPIDFKTETIPFVYMAYKRADYFKQAIDSIRKSDFPKDKQVPIIISHDGHVPEVVEYVQSLKEEGHFDIRQIFHPYSCYDHPDTFPGNDPRLNANYSGDTYHNERTWSVTCLKHHFAWLLNEVFNDASLVDSRAFLFMEEDYVVGPKVYETLVQGYRAIDRSGFGDRIFGMTLDPTDAFVTKLRKGGDGWEMRSFRTSPMALDRAMYDGIKEHSGEFCLFDELNWDWSIVSIMSKGFIPSAVVTPSKPQAIHIGLQGGVNLDLQSDRLKEVQGWTDEAIEWSTTFEVPKNINLSEPRQRKRWKQIGYGGWGHPADKMHCSRLFRNGPRHQADQYPLEWLEKMIAEYPLWNVTVTVEI